MKITIEVDCTPEEARAFMGMPDVRPLQDEIMADMKQRMKDAAANFEPEAALKAWMGASSDGMEQMMRFWQQIGQGKDKP
jgi:hypothetical protein